MKIIYSVMIIVVLAFTSACSILDHSKVGEPASHESTVKDTEKQGSTESVTPILIVVDQTEQPGMNGNAFTFQVEQLPKGYALASMAWHSKKTQMNTTLVEAANNGATGDDGFYISGDGQFSGFIYPDAMKGEEGKVLFVFKNETGNELTWQKELTLK
ncbi:hypothetical protein [Paenibacillus selenitireducens]|nr:hypothetical protein [Paenibacillus selenitireducens]